MGYRPYHGPIATVDQAIWADLPVRVICMRCSHYRQMHAFKLKQIVGDKVETGKLKLSTTIDNVFRCDRCRKRVPVQIIAPMDWVVR